MARKWRPSCWSSSGHCCCGNERRKKSRTRPRPLMNEQHTLVVPPEAAGQRLDQFLTAQLEGVSRSRVQLLLEQGDVVMEGARPKASYKLRGGESIVITG